jgi:hypothetical protein
MKIRITVASVFAHVPKQPRWTRSPAVVLVWVSLMLHLLSEQGAAGTHWPVKVLKRLLAPCRSHAFLQTAASPCDIGLATCFAPESLTPSPFKLEPKVAGEDLSRPAMLELHTGRGGPLAHHWLELEGVAGRMTIGFGPATLPFIDAGQVSLQDRYGNIKRISHAPAPVSGLASDQLPLCTTSGGRSHTRETDSIDDGSIGGFGA